MTASVSADELRFADTPLTEVRFDGSPGRESVSRSERTNLPDRVEAGVGYRDVQVDYRLATRLHVRDDEVPGPEDVCPGPVDRPAGPQDAPPDTAAPGTGAREP